MRLYLDTSVFGGVFDNEFSEESRLLFEEICHGRFVAVVSSLTQLELASAPENV